MYAALIGDKVLPTMGSAQSATLAAPSPPPNADRKTASQAISPCIAGVISSNTIRARKTLRARSFAAKINLAAAVITLK